MVFFTNDPKDFEPLEKEQFDAMLEMWEKELVEQFKQKAALTSEPVDVAA